MTSSLASSSCTECGNEPVSDGVALFLNVKKKITLQSVSFYVFEASLPDIDYELYHRNGHNAPDEHEDKWRLVQTGNATMSSTQDCLDGRHVEIVGFSLVLTCGKHQLKIISTHEFGISLSSNRKRDVNKSFECSSLEVCSAARFWFPDTGEDCGEWEFSWGFWGSFRFMEADETEPLPSIMAYQTGLLKDPVDTDVILSVGIERVPAHRIILSRVPYFKVLLNGSFSESRMAHGSLEHVVTVHDLEASTLRRVLHYVYTDGPQGACADLKICELMALARAANLYGLPALQAAAEVLMCQNVEARDHISSAQIIDILQYSIRYDSATLKETALDFIHYNFSMVAKEPSFHDLAGGDAETYSIIVDAVGTCLQAVKRPRHS
eukprot:gnl/MRDRNA2_/MRDRNA2_136017_c0_seq1.p1 gnl/MRDRNA2_/MRDRNA2_136017_c0~~gnl/MRDRNA2_/MRDRNA2_136017_c0_seq1.p1  ORF type:complete len:380 (+),score=60.31 gnl/MRDRNA2_/MRDRNA2_136017_c0_seq1:62-1201(+)